MGTKVEPQLFYLHEKKLGNSRQKPKKRNVFFDGNVVCFRMLQILGTLPISESCDGCEFTFRWISFNALYCITIFLGLLTANVFMVIEEMEVIDCYQGSQKILEYAHMALASIYFTTLTFFLGRNKILEYLKNWDYFQMNFESTTGAPLKLNFKKQQLFYSSSMFCSGIWVTYVAYTFNSSILLQCSLQLKMFSLQTFFLFLSTYLFFIFFGSIHFMLHAIRKTSDQVLSNLKKSDGSEASIRKYRILWQDLRNLTNDFGWAFSATLMFLNLVGVGVTVVSWYVLLMIPSVQKFATIVTCTWTTICYGSISDAAHRTVEKVSDFRKQVLEMKKQVTSFQQEFELSLFENIIAVDPPSISVCGFFKLDRSTLTSVYLNCAQAMVIIYQLKTEAEQSQFITADPIAIAN